MNIAQTKQIDIVDFLKAIGCFPARETACAAWFRAPYREDMTPSIKIGISGMISMRPYRLHNKYLYGKRLG